MRARFCVAAAMAAVLAPRAARAFTIESYGPEMWGVSDAKLGFPANARVEDFEDTTLLTGLDYGVTGIDPAGPGLVSQLPSTFDPTTDRFGKAFVQGAWDGSHVVINTLDNLSRDYAASTQWGILTLRFENGAVRVGVSITDMERDNTLYVNGAPLGVLGRARGTTNLKIASQQRNGYLVVAAGPGEVINSIAIDNGGNGDGWALDHVVIVDAPVVDPDAGVDAAAPTTPSPGLALMLLGDDLESSLYQYVIKPGAPPALVSVIATPSANGTAVSPTGELFVADFSGGGVNRFLAPFAVAHANGRLTASGLTYPEQMAFVGGELWVVASDLAASVTSTPIVRFGFDAQGNATTLAPLTDGLTGADRGMLWVAETADLYVSQCCTANDVLHFHADNDGTLTQLTPLTSPDLMSPHGMVMLKKTAAPGRELVVASNANSALVRFAIDVEGEGTPDGMLIGNQMANPVGLAVAPWGELWVASQGNGALSRFTIDPDSADLAPSGALLREDNLPRSRTSWIQIVEAPTGCAPPTAPGCVAMRPTTADGSVLVPVADAGAIDAPDDVPSPPPSDASSADAATDAPTVAKAKSGCGCEAAGAPRAGGVALGLAFALSARRRRRATERASRSRRGARTR
ncbi:MAG TPA: MYXO-CTERM sorting domain-containing protein [Polyangia bacterium]|nr:MYXO-CTERM sorting domain-containing protein [Polyangia bacterium]